jgi:hypothetical protein
MPEENQGNNQEAGNGQQNQSQQQNETFEVWLDKQDDSAKGLYKTHCPWPN